MYRFLIEKTLSATLLLIVVFVLADPPGRIQSRLREQKTIYLTEQLIRVRT